MSSTKHASSSSQPAANSAEPTLWDSLLAPHGPADPRVSVGAFCTVYGHHGVYRILDVDGDSATVRSLVTARLSMVGIRSIFVLDQGCGL